MHRRTPVIAAALAGTATLLWAVPAGAHVGAAIEQQDGSTVTVAFTFHHGCDGEATTGLKVQLPEGTTGVSAQNPDGWTSTTSDTLVEWTGGSIPDGDDGEFVATMTLTATDGQTVFFPTIQVCPSATNDWIELVDAGGAEPENPAPTVVMGTVGASEHGGDKGEHGDEHSDGEHEHSDEADTASADAEAEHDETASGELGAEATATATTAATSDADDSSNTGLIIGAVVVAAAAIGGGVFVTQRRKASA